MIALEKIISDVKSLPSLPESVARISKAIRDVSSEIKDFEKIIVPDPALTTNLLRLSNSAYFGFAHKITSVKQAISLMGINRVYELALSGAFSSVIPKFMTGYNIPAISFWEHSVAVAIISEVLAKRIRFSAKDQIFTAGLLHDIGKIVLAPHLYLAETEQKQDLPKESIIAWEQTLTGTDHAEVGSLLSQIWNLPEACEEVIRWHHNPHEVPNDSSYTTLIQIVSAADALAHMFGYGHNDFSDHHHPSQELLDKFGLNDDVIIELAQETLAPITQMKQFFLTKAG